jgi:hypothetical protein
MYTLMLEIDEGLHEALEACRATQQTHWAVYPLELTHTWDGEGIVWTGSWVQDHLPKASCQVNGAENGAQRMADLPNALTYIFHGVLVSVGLVLEGP